MQPKPFPNHKTTEIWRESKSRSPFFRSLLELYRAYVIIGTGSKEVPKVQAVNSVEANSEGDHIVYRISSIDLAGVHYKMTLLYNPARGGEIRFKHMENILWKRHPESSGQATVESTTPSQTAQPKRRKLGR